jgi:hypothetical protein
VRSGTYRLVVSLKYQPRPPNEELNPTGAHRSGWLTAFGSRILLDAPRLDAGA